MWPISSTRMSSLIKITSMLISLSSVSMDLSNDIFLPIDTKDRQSIASLKLTSIGKFGLKRNARKNIPSHYHSGIDIRRPNNNYINEPIYPITEGTVISKRTDGPFAQLIIEHESGGMKLWTLYEHIAGITVDVHSVVHSNITIARFMNKDELNRYGWQFDHFHFEIMRVKPIPLKTNTSNPERYYNSYSLVCYTGQQLDKYFLDPYDFFKRKWK